MGGPNVNDSSELIFLVFPSVIFHLFNHLELLVMISSFLLELLMLA